MNKNQMLLKVLSILCLLSLLAACAPASTEAPANTEAPAATEPSSATEAPAATAPAAAEVVTLTYYIDDNPTNVASAENQVAAFEAANPDIKVEIETHPGGGEGDNLVKTRLATGEMADVFRYNAGSLFQALNPQENMLDLTDEAFQADVLARKHPNGLLDRETRNKLVSEHGS